MKKPQLDLTAKRLEDIIIYPCSIEVKCFIANNEADHKVVKTFIEQYLPEGTIESWNSKISSGNKYLSLSVGVHAQSRQQLDDLYQALVAHDKVLMVI